MDVELRIDGIFSIVMCSRDKDKKEDAKQDGNKNDAEEEKGAEQ